MWACSLPPSHPARQEARRTRVERAAEYDRLNKPAPDRRLTHPTTFTLKMRPRSVRLSATGADPSKRRPASTRGAVKAWSRRSRLRFMERLSQRLFAGVSVYIVLTYPGDYERDPATWKRHLAAFRRRWEREHGKTRGCWSMEFQRRGAVHFNLGLVLNGPLDLDALRAWVSLAWFEIVGSEDSRHLAAGASSDFVTDDDGLGRYLVREIGKWHQKTLPDYASATGAGRWWGIWRVKSESVDLSLSPQEYVRCRRVLRRMAHGKRFEFRPRTAWQGLLVFDDSEAAWSVAIALAKWLRVHVTVDPLQARL